ncbi:TraB/GumN family protein [Flavimarina sp. Hel_I_48]|uniref:TraB/GumN family protein n=1 Tax=Flavimarina sp. Hel_I_48 TaxID=1392488 RepID=UPI0004DFB3B0|nr:TraB/GumN family protein [Flavimarina sp. Hel_I_48]
MKQYLLRSALFVLILSFNSSQAQEKTNLENSVLWKVEHTDLKQPSYIFGSFHFMCEKDFKIPKKVTEAFENAEALVLEVNLSDPDEMQIFQESISHPKKISDELSEQHYEKLDSLVNEVTGQSLEAYDSYGLSMLHSLMITKMLPCANLKSFENELTKMAAESNKPIFSLEKASQQIEILKKTYHSAFAFKQIMLFEYYKKDLAGATAAYKKEELTHTVDLIMKERYMDRNAMEVMQIERNKSWAEKMPQMMHEKSNLFAVGAAHLVREYGIINLLRKKGYTVTPVKN